MCSQGLLRCCVLCCCLLRAALLLAALLDEAVVALVAWSGFVDRVFWGYRTFRVAGVSPRCCCRAWPRRRRAMAGLAQTNFAHNLRR